jgi:L-lactate dehydrogenase (cytochrome)
MLSHYHRYRMNTYTVEEVAEHATKTDCWIIIKQMVYDVSEFMKSHPGGSAIMMNVAGQDATEYFEELHRPEILDDVASTYLIGEIGGRERL